MVEVPKFCWDKASRRKNKGIFGKLAWVDPVLLYLKGSAVALTQGEHVLFKSSAFCCPMWKNQFHLQLLFCKQLTTRKYRSPGLRERHPPPDSISFDIKSVNGRHNLLLFIFIMVVKEMAQVTQISMARAYYLTTGSQATSHIILTLNCSLSYSSGHCVSLSWSLHFLNWESIKCHLISPVCSAQFIFMQEMNPAAWSSCTFNSHCIQILNKYCCFGMFRTILPKNMCLFSA